MVTSVSTLQFPIEADIGISKPTPDNGRIKSSLIRMSNSIDNKVIEILGKFRCLEADSGSCLRIIWSIPSWITSNGRCAETYKGGLLLLIN